MATAADPPVPSAAPPPPLPPSSTSSSSSASPYPFAAAPDIVRAHQKDAYFTGHLASTLTDLHRRLFGARAAHAAAPELRAAAALTYLALTTLPGNRTLGEEYCDLVQVSARERGRLPTLARRAAYVAASVLLPYLARRVLPPLRARLRARLEARVDALEAAGRGDAREARLWRYVAAHLVGLTGAAPLQAVTLALFYFRGTYYELTKRALGLRYVFTRAVPDTPDRAGYEVLGVLLVVQLAVRGWLHVREALAETRLLATANAAAAAAPPRERAGFHAAAAAPDVSLDHDNAYGAANSDLLLAGGGPRGPQASRVDLAAATHTPGGAGAPARFDLADERVMGYVKGAQQRKCTLCLEELKDPSATPCGHVFCWDCIGDWVREKPECPLCRRDALVQHILPLRVF